MGTLSNNKSILSTILVLVLFSFGISASSINSCQTVTESSILTQNLTFGSTTCLTVAASDLVLDCQGYFITGPNVTNTGQGLDVSTAIFGRGVSNVTVTNCSVSGMDHGIYFEGAHDISVENNTITNYFLDAIYIEGASDGGAQLMQNPRISFSSVESSAHFSQSNLNGQFDMSVFGNLIEDANVPSAIGINLHGINVVAQLLENNVCTNPASEASEINLAGTGTFTVARNGVRNGRVFTDESFTLNLGSNGNGHGPRGKCNGASLQSSTIAKSVSFSSYSHSVAPLSTINPRQTKRKFSFAGEPENVGIVGYANHLLELSPGNQVNGEFVNLKLAQNTFKFFNPATGNEIPSGSSQLKDIWIKIDRTFGGVPCLAYFKDDMQNFVSIALTSEAAIKYSRSATETVTFSCTEDRYVQGTSFNSETGQSSVWLIQTGEQEPLPVEEVISLVPVSDSYVWGYLSNQNYGSINSLQVYPRTTISKRSLLHFDLSSIPQDAIIESAELYLFESQTYGSAREIGLHKVQSAPWTESGVTWNKYDGINPWLVPGGDFVPLPSALAVVAWNGTLNQVKWDLTSDVVEIVNYGAENYGWVLKDELEDNSQKYWYFHSKESSFANKRPYLKVKYLHYPV